MSAPDTYRGWTIVQNWIGEWEATGPGFDAELIDGRWIGNGERVTADTYDDVRSEIDEWCAENGQFGVGA